MTSIPTVVVTFVAGARDRAVIADALGASARTVYLADLDDAGRQAALRNADAILARHTGKEVRPDETTLLDSVRLIQFVTAGVDHIPLGALPAHVPIASNGGAYADAMAEHALAMTLAAVKRLFIEHAALAAGAFNQGKRNRRIAGMTCAILGFGGIGAATARLMRAVGMTVHAINRSGLTDEAVDWIGTTADLDRMLRAADVLVVSVPLTRATQGMIGARELGLMRPDAVLVNLARGEIIDEAALFAHLQANPDFTACLDAWWIEPVRHGMFRMDHPFLGLPNVIGSPHNSASAPNAGEIGLRRAIGNIRKMLDGGQPLYLIGPDERAFTLIPA
jgi:phosphoglycerate dehydrogenase-like enzyme